MTTDTTEEENPSDIELRSPAIREMLRRGRENPIDLWGGVAAELHWFDMWDSVYREGETAEFAWFEGGFTNACYNAVDYHVERGAGNRAALIYETGERDVRDVLTYRQLLEEVESVAAMLRGYGIGRGDRVTIYMPMVPEAVVTMLACARIGAIHSVVFGGFGAAALADRIDLAESKLLVTADVGYRDGEVVDLKRIVDRTFAEHPDDTDSVEDVIVLARTSDPTLVSGRDIPWVDAMKRGAQEEGGYVQMNATDPVFILPTSGTTGRPKGVVHTHGGYQVHVYAMAKWMFGLEPTDVWWATSDIGWIVGHSYIVYAPLLVGSTTVVYEGTPTHPNPGVWWRVIQENGVNKVFTAPTAIRALAGFDDDWHERYNLETVESVFSAGEPLNPPAWEWLQETVFEGHVPVIDHMWQTETAGPIVGNPYGIDIMPIKPGSATIPLPGIDTEIVDRSGEPVATGEEGALVIDRPFPGLTATLWEGHDRYRSEYWDVVDGRYWVGDAVSMDEDGYVYFHGRADEVIQIAGHRIGPTDVEDALVGHEAVVEAAVVAKPDAKRNEVIAAFVVLSDEYEPSANLREALIQRVREDVGPIAVIEDLVFTDQLPKTRSGKIMRRTIQDIMLDRSLGDVSTMEDRAAVDEIERAVSGIETDRTM